MWKLEDCRVVFFAVGLAGVLLFASPTLALVLHLPSGEAFSELWVLGFGHMAEEYPFNVREGEEYLVYVGVGNHMGSSVYYVVYVKFRNQLEYLANATTETPSTLVPLYEYRVFLEDGESWEAPLWFSFSGVSFYENECFVERMVVNGVPFDVSKGVLWDAEHNGFYYQLFMEL